jgi:hypothetical protein
MPPPRQDRRPERTQGITVELTEFGLWIEVHDPAGGWQGVFLSARALRRLVAMAPEPPMTARWGRWPPWPPSTRPCPPAEDGVAGSLGTRTATASPAPPSNSRRGREWGAQPLGLGGAPSLHHHKE